MLRYGRFTDAVFELPNSNPDIHILFGPNEAGKSTSLSALEDFLFGIPINSRFNFLHEYPDMRIGAVLESDSKTFEARRRKGKKDTLLTLEEVPIPSGDTVLAKFLAGADRSFFEQMFSLDHERLRQGGREILEAKNEVGQVLFSAGTGIAGLRDCLRALDAEGDALWASRRAGHRVYYQAEDRLRVAENAIREHTVTTRKWDELRRAYAAAEEAYVIRDQEINDKSADLRKLSRIRRVYRDIQSKSDLDVRRSALGNVTILSFDTRQTLEAAERDDERAIASVDALTEQLDATRKKGAALSYDEALLQRSDDIGRLHELRIKVRVGRADLPKRQAELFSAESDLLRLAVELDWETSEIGELEARIPARARIAAVRMLLSRRGELLLGAEASRTSLEESEARHLDLTQQIVARGTPVDVSTLAAIIRAIQEGGDISSRIKGTEDDEAETQALIRERFKSLMPEVSDEVALTSMNVPPVATVQNYRDDLRDLDQRLNSCQERIRVAKEELARLKAAHLRVSRDEHAVAYEDIVRMRQHRDSGWTLIRRTYIDDVPISEDEVNAFTRLGGDISSAYEDAVHNADETADRRFDKAEAAASLAVISGQIDNQQDLLERLIREEQALHEQRQAVNTGWDAIWRDMPLSPLPPDGMLEWIGLRVEVLGLVERRATAERRLAALRVEEAEAKDRVLKELQRLGVGNESIVAQPLRVILEAASGVQRRHEQDLETRRNLEEGLRNAEMDVELKRKAAENARRLWSEWQSKWDDSLSGLGLNTTAGPETIAMQVDAMDKMREIAVIVNELRINRIGKIERDIDAFRREVAEIVSAVAPDLASAEPDDAVLELESRLDEASRVRELSRGADEAIESFELKIEEFEESRRSSRETISHLQNIAGVENTEDLKAAITRSESLRELETEFVRIIETLSKEGDGLSITELQDECNAADLDVIAAREDTLVQEIHDLREALMEAREKCTETRQDYLAIGGDNAAASAAADRQAALAEINEIAEKYVRVRSSALLLQWAIDHYRREKQGPLLKRASQLFATLTGGSFDELGLEFDEDDHAHLAGRRADGENVGVGGMSTGTADQLYLALRVAAVEEYVERANPLPFVADDLFINFDDERAAAGFEVLGQLSQKTQVLFFTHHQHLLDIARNTLGLSVSVIQLV